MTPLADLLDQARKHQQGGDLVQAEALCRQVLQANPQQVDAMYLLALVAFQVGRHDQAIELAQQMLQFKPDCTEAYNLLGVTLALAGRLDEAASCYLHAVWFQPGNAEAHNNLGMVYHAQGKREEALTCFRQAVQLKPDLVPALENLGRALKDQGLLIEAIGCYRRMVEMQPDNPQTHANLGSTLQEQGLPAEAVASYRHALRLQPDLFEVHYNLGNALRDLGRLDEAVACFQRAAQLRPGEAQIYNNLGNALGSLGRLSEAEASLRQAVQILPSFAEAYTNLGGVLSAQGRLEEAAASQREALRLRPDLAQAHTNLGATLLAQGKMDEAVPCFQHALQLQPNLAMAQNNLGNVWKDQGNLEEAIACYRRAIEIDPGFVQAHSNLVYAFLYSPRSNRASIQQEHRHWERAHAPAILPVPLSFANDPSPERRLRIGYVSPDFRDHVIGRNVWPLLHHHDSDQFEITLYANQAQSDKMTERFKRSAQHWCRIAGWSDDQVTERIRHDQIDILVDLALHLVSNRLLVFARKPAPVQVTFAGYPGSTGLRAIDYRLTDPCLDPPGLDDAFYAEESYRLPHSFWCYDPQSEEPAVSPLPALAKGLVTFGCLNNFCKVNDEVLTLWASVLAAVPESRLLLLAGEGRHRQRTRDFLARHGIATERVAFSSTLPRPEYLALYHQVDIGLDTFPYNGHTTSLDAFWMGVPVITLVGHTVVGRAGLSQLTNLGLEQLAASTEQDFVRLAVDLAADLPRLEALRSGLRGRMQGSPLMDAVGFTRGIEQAYREMWTRWCASQRR